MSLTETANPSLTQTLLYLDGVSVSFDGYKALAQPVADAPAG